MFMYVFVAIRNSKTQPPSGPEFRNADSTEGKGSHLGARNSEMQNQLKDRAQREGSKKISKGLRKAGSGNKGQQREAKDSNPTPRGSEVVAKRGLRL